MPQSVCWKYDEGETPRRLQESLRQPDRFAPSKTRQLPPITLGVIRPPMFRMMTASPGLIPRTLAGSTRISAQPMSTAFYIG